MSIHPSSDPGARAHTLRSTAPQLSTPSRHTPSAAQPPQSPPPSAMAASRTDELVAQIWSTLRHPGRSAHAVRTLARADRLFSELDRRIRSGEPLPTTWRAALRPAPPPSRRGIAYEYATQCYDGVSEALRETGGVVAAWRALREAARVWERLDRALVERDPLPEPWLPAPHE
jgi:hypothetical protein